MGKTNVKSESRQKNLNDSYKYIVGKIGQSTEKSIHFS